LDFVFAGKSLYFAYSNTELRKVKEEKRLLFEKQTLKTMIRLYCRRNHRYFGGLCPECELLKTYTLQRLTHCPFGEQKNVCSHCTCHCYTREKQLKIKMVMRYSGPRMIYKHPTIALRYLWYKGKERWFYP